MIKTYRYKLKPSPRQSAALDRTLRLCRDLYNCALEQRRGRRMSHFEQLRQLVELKAAFPEYKTVHVHVLQNVIKKLNRSFVSFYRRCQAGAKRAGYPRFKGRDRYDSFTFNNVGFALAGRYLQISKIGSIKLHLSRAIPDGARIKTCTIKRCSNGWFASLTVEHIATVLPASDHSVGIDVGLENYAALSDGTFISNPRHAERNQAVVRIAQRRVARRKKSSHRRHNALRLLAKAHREATNRRLDFVHKETRKLVNKFGVLKVENLNIKGMVRGVLGKQIHDASWGAFFILLKYKAEEAGREMIEVDARYTSQTCPDCGVIKKKSLSQRSHKCECGSAMHRDTAAALVILGRAGPSGAKIGELIPCLA